MTGLRTTAIIAGLAVIIVLGQRIQITAARQRADTAEQAVAVSLAENSRLMAALADEIKKERIVTEYVDRVQVVRERAETITKEIPIYVSSSADAGCVIPAGFVSVHDAAVQNAPTVAATGDPDAPAPGVTLSTVADTVVGNYGTCHEVRAQLIALQDYLTPDDEEAK